MRVEFDFNATRERDVVWSVAAVFLVAIAYATWRYVGTVVLGIFVYYVTRPMLRYINTRVESRTLSVVIALVTISLPVLVLVSWTLLVIVGQLSRLLGAGYLAGSSSLLQSYVGAANVTESFGTTVRRILRDPGQLFALNLERFVEPLFEALTTSFGTLFNAGLHLFIVVVIAFYLLRDDYRVTRWARGTFVTEGGVVEQYFSAIDRDLKAVYFGNILNALATSLLGVVVYVVLNFFAPETIRVPEPILVGLLVGAGSLVPVIGMKIVWVPLAIGLFVNALITDPDTLWFPVAFALVSVVIVDYIPDQLLRPYVSGRSLHVGLIMLAYIFGPLLFGWYGIFLGPLILVVIFEFALILFPWVTDSDWPTVASSASLGMDSSSSHNEPNTKPRAESETEEVEKADDPDKTSTNDGRQDG